MGPPLRYLRGDVAIEPLICRWYAWPFLVAPATFAMLVRNRLIPLLESFIEDPEFHRASARDPSLRGGSFIDFDGDTALAEELLADIREATRVQLDFADALLLANDLLLRDGTGASLEPLYARLPEALRGRVELGYDLNQHASVRLIEPLLYESSLYDASLQSVRLRLLDGDHRPFMLATPVIDASSGVHVDAPFASSLYDDLARSRHAGLNEADFERLRDRLAGGGVDPAQIDSLFTEQRPRPHVPPEPGTVRLRYFGHACVLAESGAGSVLVDPSLGYERGDSSDRYLFSDLPPHIDYVLLTHNHQDHVLFEHLLQLRHKVGHVVVPRCNGGTLQDPSMRLMLEKLGFRSVIELDELQALPIPGGKVTGVPFLGEHCDLHIRSKLAFHVELEGHALLCLADSNNLDVALYERVATGLKRPDVLFLGMECTGGPMSWLYGDLLPQRMRREHDQSRRLDGSDFDGARGVVDVFKPLAVFVYAMGAEPWFTHITSIVYDAGSTPIIESDKLVQYCVDNAMCSERLYGRRQITLRDGHVGLA